MAQLVVMGAKAKCSMAVPGVTASLVLVPNMINGKSQSIATIQDFSMTVMATFGQCTSPSNPAVAAAQGSPVPCVPAIAAPWTPGSSTVTIGGKPALLSSDTCTCTLGGSISIDDAGQSEITSG